MSFIRVRIYKAKDLGTLSTPSETSAHSSANFQIVLRYANSGFRTSLRSLPEWKEECQFPFLSTVHTLQLQLCVTDPVGSVMLYHTELSLLSLTAFDATSRIWTSLKPKGYICMKIGIIGDTSPIEELKQITLSTVLDQIENEEMVYMKDAAKSIENSRSATPSTVQPSRAATPAAHSPFKVYKSDVFSRPSTPFFQKLVSLHDKTTRLPKDKKDWGLEEYKLGYEELLKKVLELESETLRLALKKEECKVCPDINLYLDKLLKAVIEKCPDILGDLK